MLTASLARRFNAGFGTCPTYDPLDASGNFGYCAEDVDTLNVPGTDLRATAACSECGICRDEVAASPTASPTTSAPTSTPTASPTTSSPTRPAAAPTFFGATTQNSGVDIGFAVVQSGSSATAQDTQSSTDATTLITGAPTTGRRRRRADPAFEVLSRHRRNTFFEEAVANNPFLTAEEAEQIAARAARLHASTGANVSGSAGATITVDCRAKVDSNGLPSVVDDNGNPTEDAERCLDTDPDDFCVVIPGCTEAIDARLVLRVDKSFAAPHTCANLVWEGQSTTLFEEVPLPTTSSGKKSPKTPKGYVPTYVEIPAIVDLLETASTGPDPRAPDLAAHCPDIATALVRGEVNAEDGVGVGEHCGQRVVEHGGRNPSIEFLYACDSVDLTAGCTGPHGNPRDPEIQQSCFEVCQAVGPTYCNGYSVDLNPVDPYDPNVATRALYGRCLLFRRPLTDFAPTAAPTLPPVTSGMGMGMGAMGMGHVVTEAPTPPTLKFHHACRFTASVADVEALPDYSNPDELCTDPSLFLPLDFSSGSSPKSAKKGSPTPAPFYDFSCADQVLTTPSPTSSSRRRRTTTPPYVPTGGMGMGMGNGMGMASVAAPTPPTPSPSTRAPLTLSPVPNAPVGGGKGGGMGRYARESRGSAHQGSPRGGSAAPAVACAVVAVVVAAVAVATYRRRNVLLGSDMHEMECGDPPVETSEAV